MRRVGADYRGLRMRTTGVPMAGTATLVAGTIVVSTAGVTASSIIMLSRQTVGGTAGNLTVGTITAGTSFVINSSNGADTSVVNWVIINPENIV